MVTRALVAPAEDSAVSIQMSFQTSATSSETSLGSETFLADLGEAAADPKRRALVEAARAGIKVVQVDIAAVLPADLGITLGFNSLDGD